MSDIHNQFILDKITKISAEVNSLRELKVQDSSLVTLQTTSVTLQTQSLTKLNDIETAIQAVETNQTDKSQYTKISDKSGSDIDENNPIAVCDCFGVPNTFTKQTANGDKFLIQKGGLNKLRIRPQILNEHAESSREIQAMVNSTTIAGQIFKASHDNINGLNLAMRSAEAQPFDDFESYADSAALQVVWIETDVADKAELETTIVYEGTKAMMLPGDATVGDEWYQAFASADFTGYTGTFHMQATHAYSSIKLRVYVYDSLGNTSSAPIIHTAVYEWQFFEFDVAALTADGGTPADVSDITRIGFRLEDRRNNSEFYIDEMISVPAPGSVNVKLWDMGATLPTGGVTSIDDGTQYTKLGDLGISGTQVAEVEVQLLGGFRVYHIDEFVAGVALEIPTNELLNTDNYYAVTVNYIDTDVDMYGPDTSFNTDYYTNGYAFTAPDEATAITKIGTYSDLMFTVYSTQDVYVNNYGQVANAEPNGISTMDVYIEDSDMKRTDTIITGVQPTKIVAPDLKSRPMFMEKGSKLECEYNDDLTDSITKISIGFRYYFQPESVHG
jgi:hypothetical protein